MAIAKKKPAPPDIKITLPPYVPPAKKGNAEEKFLTWAKAHSIDKQTAADIYYWGHQKGTSVDPYYFASVLLAESGAKQVDPITGKVKSSGQAVGIGQIANSYVGTAIPWDKGHVFTLDDNPRTGLLNYGVNLRMAATHLHQDVGKYGYAGAYTQGYNPTDPNKGKAWANIQATLKSRPGPPLAPSQGPGDQSTAAGSSPYPTFKDPYIAGVDKHNKFSTTNDPTKSLQYDGVPLTRSQFLTIRDQLTSSYVSYTGQRPSNKQIDTYIRKGWNTYTLSQLLSKSPNFVKSPIYKEYATQFASASKDLLPPGQKLPVELARQAILNHWDETTVAAKLRALPGYEHSEEFKGNVATLQTVHDSIMGSIDSQGLQSIQEAALGGWSTDQYANWLRSQPNYKTSPEYQSRSLSLLSSLGLITGQQAVLKPGAGPGPGYQPSSGDKIPTDPRGIVPYSSAGSQERSGRVTDPSTQLGAVLQ